jgi:two-component system response regulator
MELKKILLIEDNISDVELAQRALRKLNIANPLVVLEDGKEALDYLFRREKYSDVPEGDVPALILLDLKLPIVDGLTVLREIRANPKTRAFIVVILTSSKEEQDVIAGYEIGVNSFIQKPVDFSRFLEVMKQIGLYWLLLNESPHELH